MFYWIYDLPAWTVAFLFAAVFIGVNWFGAIFIRPILRAFFRGQDGINDIVGYSGEGFDRVLDGRRVCPVSNQSQRHGEGDRSDGWPFRGDRVEIRPLPGRGQDRHRANGRHYLHPRSVRRARTWATSWQVSYICGATRGRVACSYAARRIGAYSFRELCARDEEDSIGSPKVLSGRL